MQNRRRSAITLHDDSELAGDTGNDVIPENAFTHSRRYSHISLFFLFLFFLQYRGVDELLLTETKSPKAAREAADSASHQLGGVRLPDPISSGFY